MHRRDNCARAGIDRVNSQGSNISGLGGPMESVGEDQEMKGSDWASAMRILTDMEHDQQHDGHDRCAVLLCCALHLPDSFTAQLKL